MQISSTPSRALPTSGLQGNSAAAIVASIFPGSVITKQESIIIKTVAILTKENRFVPPALYEEKKSNPL